MMGCLMEKSRTLASSTTTTWTADGPTGPEPTTSAGRARQAETQVTNWFREHAEGVYRYLAGVYGSDEDAEEVTQEAFLRLYEAMAHREVIENPRAWVFTVARRLMLNRVKGSKYETVKRREFAQVASAIWGGSFRSPDSGLTQRRRRGALKIGLRGLSHLERQILFARAQGLKLRQIGGIVGLDLRRVAEIIDRSILKLQRHVRG
jgi:RNA polymerase sigma factor (sigma-70 family)